MDEITTFLADWAVAEGNGDTAALDEKLADDFVGVGPLGFTLPRAAWLARHEGGDLTYEAFDLDEVQARSYGAASVVTARHTARGTYRGHPLPTDLRTTLVVVRQGEALRLAGIHMSFIAGTPGAPPPSPSPTTARDQSPAGPPGFALVGLVRPAAGERPSL